VDDSAQISILVSISRIEVMEPVLPLDLPYPVSYTLGYD
jgi:hypothetical protein